VLLIRLRHLRRYRLCAADGEIGTLEQVYFDALNWAVRYLVVDAGNQKAGRRILISPIAAGELDRKNGFLYVELTRDQIERSPPMESRRPISRQYETEYFRYYGWPPYWELEGHEQPEAVFSGSSQILGCRVRATDGDVGHVDDVIIDGRYWIARYLQVAVHSKRAGSHVVLSPAWIDVIDWTTQSLVVDLAIDSISKAPAYHDSRTMDRDYEARLFQHYGRPAYWE
jgi:hypothetical protein